MLTFSTYIYHAAVVKVFIPSHLFLIFDAMPGESSDLDIIVECVWGMNNAVSL